MSELLAIHRSTPAAPSYPPATAENMPMLASLLAERGVELKLNDSGELRFRDSAKRLTPADRQTIHHYAEPLAAWLANEQRESADATPDPLLTTHDSPTGPRCDRCGSNDFNEVAIHAGQSIRRDCARCRRTWGFPVWYGR